MIIVLLVNDHCLFNREFRLPTYLSHREEASPSNTGLDPHLTPDQMKGSADKLVQLYREYARDMGKEYKELIIQAVSETDFKVPLAGPSDRSAKNSGRKRRLSQVIDDGESIGEDGDNSYYVVSLNDNNQDVTSSMKKQKQKPTQPRRAARQIKREKDTEEVDDEGDSYFEKYTSEKVTAICVIPFATCVSVFGQQLYCLHDVDDQFSVD